MGGGGDGEGAGGEAEADEDVEDEEIDDEAVEQLVHLAIRGQEQKAGAKGGAGEGEGGRQGAADWAGEDERIVGGGDGNNKASFIDGSKTGGV